MRTLSLALITMLSSLSPEARASETLTVAISPSPPWAYFDIDSPSEAPPEGFNVDLWTSLAEDLGVETAWRYEGAAKDVFVAVFRGDADVGLVGFPPGALQLGPAIMVPNDPPFSDPIRIFRRMAQLLSPRVLLYPLIVFFLVVHARWLVDRFSRPEAREFPTNFFYGIGESMWRVIGLLLDFGVGQPTTWTTRLFDLTWHLLGLILLSGFVGVLTAIVTLETSAQQIRSVEDVRGKTLAVVEGSLIGEHRLRELGIENSTPAPALDKAIEWLDEGKVDAVLASRTALGFVAGDESAEGGLRFRVLPDHLGRQSYAVVMRPSHPRKADVDRLLGQLHLPRGLEASISARLEAKWRVGLK